MYYSLEQMRSELKDRLKYPTIADNRLTKWLNEAQNDLSRNIDCDHLYKSLTFSLVAGQSIYFVDFDFNRIVSAINTSQDWELTQVSKSEIEAMDPNEDSGTPVSYYVEGISYVKGQPTAASAVTVVSTDAADNTQQVIIRGTVSGVDQYETLVLDGTTPVVGTKLFTEVFSIRKDQDTDGVVTATAGVVTLAILGPSEAQREYQKIGFYPIPAQADTVILRGISKPRAMIHNTDAPDFPETYHELVLIGAEVRGHFDLFHTTLAEKVLAGVYAPKLAELARQMGNKRYKRSPVIQSQSPYYWQPRLPVNITP